MSTLLLRLAAPMQSWGVESKFDYRKTGREPSKSGVVGLLAAALGRGRGESVEDLAALRFGVRVEQPGQILRDLQIAKYQKSKSRVDTYFTYRDYLCDAAFLVGLESSQEEVLQGLVQALQAPAFPLFLGRRSCPPTLPLVLGIRPGNLEETLTREPWQASDWFQKKAKRSERTVWLRVLVDAPAEEDGIFQHDNPKSFHIQRREYGYRKVQELPSVAIYQPDTETVEHNPMKGW